MHSFIFEGGQGVSQKFFLTLQELLEKKLFTWSSLKFIACGIGPGSFTGVRIAGAIAQTLAFAHKIPLIPFCSLASFIPCDVKDSFFLSLDAKSFGIYLLQAEKKGGKIYFNHPAKLIRWEDLSQVTDALFSPEYESIKKRLIEKNISIKCLPTFLNPSFLTSYCEEKFLKNEFASKAFLELQYLKMP